MTAVAMVCQLRGDVEAVGQNSFRTAEPSRKPYSLSTCARRSTPQQIALTRRRRDRLRPGGEDTAPAGSTTVILERRGGQPSDRIPPSRRKNHCRATAAEPNSPDEGSDFPIHGAGSGQRWRAGGLSSTEPDSRSPSYWIRHCTATRHGARADRETDRDTGSNRGSPRRRWRTNQKYPSSAQFTARVRPAAAIPPGTNHAYIEIFGGRRHHVRRERRAPEPSKERTKLTAKLAVKITAPPAARLAQQLVAPHRAEVVPEADLLCIRSAHNNRRSRVGVRVGDLAPTLRRPTRPRHTFPYGPRVRNITPVDPRKPTPAPAQANHTTIRQHVARPHHLREVNSRDRAASTARPLVPGHVGGRCVSAELNHTHHQYASSRQ